MLRRDLLKGVLCTAGVVSLPKLFAAASSDTTATAESRAIFDESSSWLTKDDAARLISRIKSAGFNVLIPCVWHGMGATWNSSIAPKIKKYPGGDPLANLCSVATQNGIEVHPWFSVALRQREFLSRFVRPGTPDQMFEIHLPQFRDFIVSVILEVVENYPVQGINLDYIRAGGIGTSSLAVADYRTRTGRELRVDKYLETEAARSSIGDWQAAAVVDIVRKVAVNASTLRPGIVISICGNPGVPDVALQGQDGVRWTNDGLIDVVFNMDYRPNPDFEGLLRVRERMSRPEALVQLVGNYKRKKRMGGKNYTVTPRDPELVARLLAQSREFSRGNGVALYLYSMLSDGQIATLRDIVFTRDVRPAWQKRSPIPAKKGGKA